MDLWYEWDRQAFYLINHGLSHPLLDRVMWLITSLGLGWVQALLLLVWTLTPAWTRRGKVSSYRWKHLFLAGSVTILLSGLVVQILKHLFPRMRPSNLPDALVAPDERLFYNSFPSGHTATSFALACWLWGRVRGTPYRWVGYVAWGLAGLIGLSRIYRGVHYPLDVLVSVLVGIVCGFVVNRVQSIYEANRR
ncbi:MAG: hypothetical protein C4337_01050 [Armatimonadota bacterium]